MDFKDKLKHWTNIVNTQLEKYLFDKDAPEAVIYKAMNYSLSAGGKRMRPILALAVCELLGGDEKEVLPYACAIELIHTYSLIHDDLPAMDDDDFRRGMPTNHKVFGEAMAILAGDALLNKAFEIMADDVASCGERACTCAKAMSIIARASGTEGMIGGQVVDLQSTGKIISPEILEYMHRSKTGALIKAPVLSSAVLCGAKPEEYESFDKYSGAIGLAFQIKDDIMDLEGSFEEMGKTAGADSLKEKSTFVTIYGLEKAKRMLDENIAVAISALDIFGEKAGFLKDLAVYIGSRKN
jgi:geranylgeranyl diphosphate synthase type II